jgi:Concanavalin A-like lectin/glucanases superfamily
MAGGEHKNRARRELAPSRGARVMSAAGVFAVMLAIAAAAQAAPPLVAQWPLDEAHTSGATDYTEDVSGNGLSLTSPANTMRFGTESGKFGGYLASTNTTTLEANSSLLAPEQLTLLAWIKQSGDPGVLKYIAGRGDDGSNCGGSSYALYTGYPGSPGLHFYIRSGNQNILTDVPATSAVFDGNWHLIAGTYDGTSIRLFVDGTQVGSAKPAGAIDYGLQDSSFYVDGYPPAAGCGGAPDFPGDIDEVRVYDRALSASELGRLAAAPGPQPPALVPDETGGPSGPFSPPGPVEPGGSSGSSPSPGTGGAPLGLTMSPVQTTTLSPSYTVLKIASTGFASKTTISIDGGKPIMDINPITTPYIGLRIAEGGSHTITATSIGVGGGSASSSTIVRLSPGSGETKKPAFLPDAAVATSIPQLLIEGAELAAIGNECAPNSTVVFGVAEATGCFERVHQESELPRSERAVAGEYVEESAIIERLGANAFPILHHEGANGLRTLSPAEQPFVSTKPVLLDGMTITPRPGAAVVVFPAIGRVVSSNAQISYDGSIFGNIPVKTGPLNLDLTTEEKRFSNGDAELPLFRFNTSDAFKDIGGFPINGEVQVVFKKSGEQRYTALIVNVSLPEEIKDAVQADPTAMVEVNANNTRGTYLNQLNIHLNEAFLGPVKLANVDFTYNDGGNSAEGCPRKWWKATAEVFFIPDGGEEGGGVKMAPEPQRNGIAFCAGKFQSAGAILDFGAAAPEIFPGVTLNKIGFDIQLSDPVLFDGSATIRSAELVTATGGFLSVFASPGHPYTIKPGDAGGTIAQLAGQRYESPTFAIGGKVEVEPFPEVGLELGGAYLLYSYPDFIAAKGYAHLQTFLFTINAEGSLELDASTRKFNALVKGEVCLAGGIEVEHIGLCAGGEARVSSRGLSVCFDIGGWTPGVGYVYGASTPEFFAGALGDGCKPSHFWEKDVRAARVSAVDPITFTVKRGEKLKNLQLTGAGGAPAVTLRTPGGETIATQSNKMLHSGRLSAISSDRFKTTWLGVERAESGTYQVIPQPGSPAIVQTAETHYEQDAGVSAKLSHKGHSYVLHYDAGHAAGQKVTFIEKGKNIMRTLRSVSGGKGTMAFQPQPGSPGKREIAAVVEVDGIPAPPLTLAHFSAPSLRAGVVSRVRVRHLGNALALSWRPAANATSYTVAIVEHGGAVRTLHLRGSAHKVTVQGVPANEAGRVEVLAAGLLGDRGKPGKVRFAATRSQQSRLLPLKELGSGAPFAHHTKAHHRHR